MMAWRPVEDSRKARSAGLSWKRFSLRALALERIIGEVFPENLASARVPLRPI